MSAAAVLIAAAAAGVTLSLSAGGNIKAQGEQAAIDRLLPAVRANKAGILSLLAGNDDAANEPPLKSWRWLVHYADRDSREAAFSPVATHAEVLDAFPDAVAAEPLDEASHAAA